MFSWFARAILIDGKRKSIAPKSASVVVSSMAEACGFGLRGRNDRRDRRNHTEKNIIDYSVTGLTAS
jgi:hypothetical protein